jgi:hypothetical protein
MGPAAAFDLMDDEAFVALEAIGRSQSLDEAGHQHWIKAFKAIRWVVQTEAGLALTTAGRQARDEMAAERSAELRTETSRRLTSRAATLK